MTEFFFPPSNPANLANQAGLGHSQSTREQVQNAVASYGATLEEILSTESVEPAHSGELNLKDALEWLFGAEISSPEEIELDEEEMADRQRRRDDLLVWLMNLELRLNPYGDPAF